VFSLFLQNNNRIKRESAWDPKGGKNLGLDRLSIKGQSFEWRFEQRLALADQSHELTTLFHSAAATWTTGEFCPRDGASVQVWAKLWIYSALFVFGGISRSESIVNIATAKSA
jgi:hypothetical protein